MRGTARTSPVSTKPARSATRWEGRLSRVGAGSRSRTAPARSAPSRAAARRRRWPRRARAPRRRSSSRSRRSRARGRPPSARPSRSGGRSRRRRRRARRPRRRAASAAATARNCSASSRVYGDGTRVQRGISGSRQAATMSGMSRGAIGRTPILPSDSVGATMAGMRPSVAQSCQHAPPWNDRSPARSSGWPPRSWPGRRSATAWPSPPCGARAATRRWRPGARPATPLVSLIVAAYDEERVIAAKVANALALDWPRDRLEIVVAVDGGADPGADATAERARAAGADLVLELPARRQGARAGRRRGGGARDAARVLGRQRRLGAGRPARAGHPVRRPRRRLRRAARSGSSTRRAPTRRGCTGATRCGCGAASRRSSR